MPRRRRPCSRTGYEDGQYPFVLYTTARFYDIKQRRNCSFLTSSSIAITSLTMRSWVAYFNEFIVEVKSYMDVSSETSDARKVCPSVFVFSAFGWAIFDISGLFGLHSTMTGLRFSSSHIYFFACCTHSSSSMSCMGPDVQKILSLTCT